MLFPTLTSGPAFRLELNNCAYWLNCGSASDFGRVATNEQPVWIAEYCIVQSAFCNLHNGIMLYDAVCHANLESVIRYPYPIRIRGIVENDIRIYLYPQKFTDIRKYPSAVPYPRTSGYSSDKQWYNQFGGNAIITINQYASPPRQCNTGSPLERFWRKFVLLWDSYMSTLLSKISTLWV